MAEMDSARLWPNISMRTLQSTLSERKRLHSHSRAGIRRSFFEDKGISKEVLEESYLRTESISKTVAELKLTMGTTYNYLLKNKIQRFESPQAKKEKLSPTCTPEALKDSYNNHKTISGVASKFGIRKQRQQDI